MKSQLEMKTKRFCSLPLIVICKQINKKVIHGTLLIATARGEVTPNKLCIFKLPLLYAYRTLSRKCTQTVSYLTMHIICF